MRCLGAILAGGQARRFGSDKAHALVGGKRLIDVVGASLAVQCDTVIVCGREEPGFACIPDRPEAGQGPLGGLNAALHYAQAHGFDAVLSSGCDVPNLPSNLVNQLAGEGAAIVSDQPVVGFWPAELSGRCDAFLKTNRRALFGFADYINARRVEVSPALVNINAPDDLPG